MSRVDDRATETKGAAAAAAARADLTAHPVDAVVVGGSAGSIDGLQVLLPGLPRDLRVPVLAVVHLPAGHQSWLPSLFASACEVPVREAIDKQRIEPGVVLLAPSDCHLLVERDQTVSLSVDEPIHFSRPSIDVLFESAVWAWGARLLGILLSGANADGAAGLRAIAAAGGQAWVQDPDTAHATVMPMSGLRAAPSARSLPLAAMRAAFDLLSAAAGGEP